MASVLIRNLPEATHRALKQRARARRHSTEAEIRDILTQAVEPKQEGIGSVLAAFGREFGGVDLDIERERAPSPPVDFE